jgi:hypothetical protein
MPIKPSLRWLYPIDWPQLSRVIRFERAKGRCEHCGRPHGQTVFHLGDGRWFDAERTAWRDQQGRRIRVRLPEPVPSETPQTRVRLSTAHLDHDLSNNDARNLAALCQRCHMQHNRVENQRRRWMTLRARKAIGDLFMGLYPA